MEDLGVLVANSSPMIDHALIASQRRRLVLWELNSRVVGWGISRSPFQHLQPWDPKMLHPPNQLQHLHQGSPHFRDPCGGT